MQWGGVRDFWAMGGDGPFVWGAYAAVLLALIAELWALRRRRKRAIEAVSSARGQR